MDTKNLVVTDFDSRPYGRYPADGHGCGQNYREKVLAPALKNNARVHVVLDGYNRYGRSFLDEAFGGLVRKSGFKGEELKVKLSYSHDLIPSFIKLIDDRIEEAVRDCKS